MDAQAASRVLQGLVLVTTARPISLGVTTSKSHATSALKHVTGSAKGVETRSLSAACGRLFAAEPGTHFRAAPPLGRGDPAAWSIVRV